MSTQQVVLWKAPGGATCRRCTVSQSCQSTHNPKVPALRTTKLMILMMTDDCSRSGRRNMLTGNGNGEAISFLAFIGGRGNPTGNSLSGSPPGPLFFVARARWGRFAPGAWTICPARPEPESSARSPLASKLGAGRAVRGLMIARAAGVEIS